jgi:hypothetical protein
MQYRNGIITSAGSAINLQLGFVPDRFTVTNYTIQAAQSGVGFSEWINNVVPSGDALIWTLSAGVPTISLITSNGFTPINLGADWAAEQATITGATAANPVVITAASHGFSNGDTVTISSVVGMIQLNTNRYTVAAVTTNTFALYDLFGNPVNGTAFGTYVSGGIANRISTQAIAPVLNATTGQVITPGLPPGDFYDLGYAGITLGSGVVGSSTNVLFWEAWAQTPTGW